MRTRTNKKYIAIVLMAMLTAGVQPAPAQGFFNKLKNKAKEVLDNVTHVENNASANGKNKPTAGAQRHSTNGDGNRNADIPAIAVPKGMENMHAGTIHSEIVEQNGYDAPKMTASTVYVPINGNVFSYSNFYDGVAYINSHEDGRYYIDLKGNRLFNSHVETNASKSFPRFNNGVVMEVGYKGKSVDSKRSAFIMDKKGNIIKEFGTDKASNFEDGVAVVALGKNPTNTKEVFTWVFKYVDTKGNFVYPKLWFSSPSVIMLDITNLARKSSEGLTAYVTYDNAKRKYLWGFHDGKGNIIVQPKYVEVSDFHDGMASVCSLPAEGGRGAQSRWGYIDKSGREVIPAKYTVKPSDFDSGLARVFTRDKDAYIIDKTGKQVYGPVKPYSIHSSTPGTPFYISQFHNGVALLGYIDTDKVSNGAKIFYSPIDINFNKLGSYAVLNDGGTSNMNNTMNVLYKELGWDLVYSSKEDNIFYIQQEQNFTIVDPKTLDRIYNVEFHFPLVNGLSRYEDSKGNYGYLNKNGEYVIKFKKNEF
ncbi:MAG: WG repeat-containing protein [Prevotella sp.]|nr:WG repeat-containing protein [Prevotella sp.]